MSRRETLWNAMKVKLHKHNNIFFKCFICSRSFEEEEEFLVFIDGENKIYDFMTLKSWNYICKNCFMENYE